MKILKWTTAVAIFIGSLFTGVLPVYAVIDYDYYYAVNYNYSPASFLQFTPDLPLPDELQNETIRYQLSNGMSYYIYGSDEIDTNFSRVSFVSPINAKSNDEIAFSWVDFGDASDSSVVVNYLGFRLVIDYVKPNNETVTVMYDIKFINAELTVNYQDESGQAIAEPDIINGSIGDDYAVQPANISGYEFVRAEGDAESGQLTAEPKEITYIYQAAPAMGSLVVKYVDESGNNIAPEQSFSEPAGTDYVVQPAAIDGWELVDTIGSTSGQYIDGSIEVQFVYREVGQSTSNNDSNRPSLPVTGGEEFMALVSGLVLITSAVLVGLRVRKNF